MTRKPAAKPARNHASALEDPPLLPAVVPSPAETPDPDTPHPHDMLDRATMASLARLTAGLSPHAMIDAWSDWAIHLARAPGRQLELMERAQTNGMKLASKPRCCCIGCSVRLSACVIPSGTRTRRR